MDSLLRRSQLLRKGDILKSIRIDGWRFFLDEAAGGEPGFRLRRLVENGYTWMALGSVDEKDLDPPIHICDLLYTSDRPTSKAAPKCLRLAKS